MKNKKLLIITSLLILLPTIVGVLLWDQLPEQLPTHWGVDGQADGWNSKGFAVFGVPLIFLAFQWICILVSRFDNEAGSQNRKVWTVVMLVFPALSIASGAAMFAAAADVALDMGSLMPVLIGLMFLAIGNYLPKCRQNATLGIKLPWTFASEENWNKTHRLGGKVWVICGILILANTVLGWTWLFLAAIFAAILIPTVYSWLLYRKLSRNATTN